MKLTNSEVIAIDDNLYVRSPEALLVLRQKLALLDYEITNLGENLDTIMHWGGTNKMRQYGAAMYEAALRGIQSFQCNECQAVFPTAVLQHNHQCGYCAAIIHQDVPAESLVNFTFDHTEQRALTLTMRAYRKEGKQLLVYPTPVDGEVGTHGADALAYLNRFSHRWQRIEKNGVQLICIPATDRNTNFQFYRTYPREAFKRVYVCNGTAYGPDEDLPVPYRLHIIEAWHWKQLPPGEQLLRVVLQSLAPYPRKSDCNHPERREWNKDHFANIGKFIEHFTTLSAADWDQAAKNFRRTRDGYDDIAAFLNPTR